MVCWDSFFPLYVCLHALPEVTDFAELRFVPPGFFFFFFLFLSFFCWLVWWFMWGPPCVNLPVFLALVFSVQFPLHDRRRQHQHSHPSAFMCKVLPLSGFYTFFQACSPPPLFFFLPFFSDGGSHSVFPKVYLPPPSFIKFGSLDNNCYKIICFSPLTPTDFPLGYPFFLPPIEA